MRKMKKFNLTKKGFTLVELLAVIVVLAVIMLLAVNAVIPQMNKARKNAFVTEAQTYINGAETYFTYQQMGAGAVGSTKCVTIADLHDGIVEEKEGYSGVVIVDDLSSATATPTYTIYLTNGTYYISNTTNKDLSASDAIDKILETKPADFKEACN